VKETGFRIAGADGRLVLAVPSKGRLAQPSLELLEAAGLAFELGERALHVPCTNAPVELLLVRPHDIPEYVQDGVVDAGVTGANLIVETGAKVETLLELGFGRCTLEAAVPEESALQRIADLDGLRVATAYPVSTKSALEQIGVKAELVLLSGSVEAAPRLGLSDAVIDLVSTGSTASANGLRRIGTLLESQAVLIGGGRELGAKGEMLERLEMMLRGVVAARRRRYLMLNASAERVAELEALLPSMGAPSVVELAEKGQLALHAAVDVDEIWDLLPRLKAAGASSILVMHLERVVP
jgi:ATP phosphoribosyltransferase